MTTKHSHSSLSTFVECPARWKFQYLDKLEAAPVEGFREGTILHKCIEEYAKHCRAAGEDSDLDRMRAIAGRYDDDGIAGALNRFAEWHQYDWSLTVADKDGIERWFDVELPGDYGRMRGRVDELQFNEAENALWITDFKSRRTASAPNQCPKQLRLYAWAMLKQFPEVERVVCRFEYIYGGEPREWELEAPVSIKWATAIIDLIRAEMNWEATPGNACAFCGYWGQCPVKYFDLGYPFERAQYMLAMDAQLKNEKAALKRHVSEHGPIPVGNGHLDIRPSDGARRYRPRKNAKLDLLKAIAKTRLGDLPEEYAEQVLGAFEAVSPCVKFAPAALAAFVPLPDNPFAEMDAEDETVDLSRLLDEQKPSNVFGYYADDE